MSEEIIQSKIFKSGYNDTEIVSKTGTDVYFRGREKFYKNLYGSDGIYIHSLKVLLIEIMLNYHLSQKS